MLKRTFTTLFFLLCFLVCISINSVWAGLPAPDQCTICHALDTVYQEWNSSKHSGAGTCFSCHIPGKLQIEKGLLEEGEKAVKIARDVIERKVKGKEIPEYKTPDIFLERSGVFTTINTFKNKKLRGCIGFPEPVFPLIKALINSAISAATADPRFPPLNKKELNNVVIEVSLLTPPSLIDIEDVLGLIDSKARNVELVLTGRYAPKKLIEAGDYVTEMVEIKHPYSKDISARKGIEY